MIWIYLIIALLIIFLLSGFIPIKIRCPKCGFKSRKHYNSGGNDRFSYQYICRNCGELFFQYLAIEYYHLSKKIGDKNSIQEYIRETKQQSY